MSLTPERAVVLDWMTSSECYYSPLYFAKTAYAWGESDLKHHPGPRKWQQEVMLGIEKYLRDGMGLQKALNILPDYYRHAVASGRGPGGAACGWCGRSVASVRAISWSNRNGELLGALGGVRTELGSVERRDISAGLDRHDGGEQRCRIVASAEGKR